MRNRIISIASLFVVLAPANAATQPASTPGSTQAPSPVAHAQQHAFVLHDAKREKDLPIRVLYPDQFQQDGPVATIIFSHGAGGSGDYYNPLAQHWASHGYIVILPTHSDSIGRLTKDGVRDLFNTNREGERRRRGSARGLIDLTDWANRPRDISFIIDSTDLIEQQVPAIEGRIDPDRIGVGGHSFGAFTAQLIGGTDPLGPGDFTDPRSRCELLISPQGLGGLLTERSWKGFTGPALTITGDNDEGRNGEPANPWRRDPYDHSPPDTHTLLWIDDAYHNFGGISGRILPGPDQGPANPQHVELVQRATLAFWNHHLRNASDDTDAFADQLRVLMKDESVSIENN